MFNVLLKGETIALKLSKVLTPDIVDEYYVCPVVIIELMKDDKYVMDGNTTVPACIRTLGKPERKLNRFSGIAPENKYKFINAPRI